MAQLRTSDMVARFGIPEGTLRWWRSTGQGPRSYKLGRTVFYDETDVEAWVELQKMATARGGVQ